MGVSGLLGLLKSIQKPCSLKDFRGQTIGVDAYGWLHRGAVSCAVDLALGKPTTRYIDFFMHRVRMLIHFGVTPYLVFDGDRLPSKSGTEKDRSERRKESKRLGHELLRMGKTTQAYQELQKAVDITPQMARNVIEELKRSNVAYVVAPYEADSQMAYLEKKGIVEAILSEDSDLLVFGAKTLLTKLDQYGECVMIRQADFTACRDINLVGWTEAEFRQMAILSGCDYLEGIHKMGLKTAHRFVRKYKTIERVIRGIQLEAKMRVPPDYLESFIQADTTFLYQWVFCPEAQELVHLNTPTHDKQLEGLMYIGAHMAPAVARGVAAGDLDPMSKAPLEATANSTPVRRPFFANRTQSTPLASTTKALPGKGIDAFFKPNRVPLAELDPNSFQPTASQQQLLAQNNQTWLADTAPLQRTSSQPQTPTLATGQPVSARTTTTGTTLRRPLSQPNKRQRLCSDVEDDGSPQKSRFFDAIGLSSSAPATKRTAKKSGFELWSDDSVEEAMSSMSPMTSSNAQRRGKSKLTIHKDEDADVVPAPEEKAATQNVNTNEALKSKSMTADEEYTTEADESSKSVCLSDMLLADTKAMREGSALGLKRFAMDTKGTTEDDTKPNDSLDQDSEPPEASSPKFNGIEIVQDSPPPKHRPVLSAFMHSETATHTPAAHTASLHSKQALQDSAVAILDTPTIKRRKIHARGSEDMLVPDSDDGDTEGSDAIEDIASPLRALAQTNAPSLARQADSGYGTFVFVEGADEHDMYDETDDQDCEDKQSGSSTGVKRLDLGRFVFAGSA